ncbi:MAG: zinc ABC transporter substrate-binding protein [candidate division WOR-3 bacterium]
MLNIFILFFSLLKEEPIRVVVSYPYIASIVKEIGGDMVDITTLSNGTEDPHHVVPKPSLIGKLRRADILFINGASLEIGFLPPLIEQANNPKINPGSKFLIDLSRKIELIDKPLKVSRAEGDIHPEGNPHYYLSYKNLPKIAEGILEGLILVRPEKREYFENNYKNFIEKYENKKKEWEDILKRISSLKLIQYHRMFNYLAKDGNFEIVAEIEPKPGIPPTAKHIEDIVNKVKGQNFIKIVGAVYNDINTIKKLSEKTGIKYVILPHDVNSLNEVKDIFSLFDTIFKKLSE